MSNHHLRDKSLSLKAKGLLSLMLSLPEEWDYNYLNWLEKAFVIYRCQRYDLQGKAVLKTQEKFYLADPETSCQGLFNQIHEKVTNELLFFARTSLLSPAHGI